MSENKNGLLEQGYKKEIQQITMKEIHKPSSFEGALWAAQGITDARLIYHAPPGCYLMQHMNSICNEWHPEMYSTLISYSEVMQGTGGKLEEVLEKYLEFKRLVIEPGKTPTITVKSWGIDNDLYLFCPHRVSRGDTHEVPGLVPASVLSQAADFARTWFEQMDEAADRARAILAASWFRYNEGNASEGKSDAEEKAKEQRGVQESNAGKMDTKPPANGKITVNCSVARVGLHLRLLKDEGLFVDTSVVDLCKILSKVIRTVNQEDISYRSLKNAMDAPKEQAIRLFMEKWADYLERAGNDMYLN